MVGDILVQVPKPMIAARLSFGQCPTVSDRSNPLVWPVSI
jgi:hypothetical protein